MRQQPAQPAGANARFVMKMDWPLIGAIGGLTASVLVLGVGAVAILRSAPDEMRKAPPAPPVLLSSRSTVAAAPAAVVAPAAVAASPVLHVYANAADTATSGLGSAEPVRQRPAPVYELFPGSTAANAAPAAAELRPG